ncbi:TolC family protein [bacterium]|nr:TolC family protein [bacterium]
MRQIFAGGWAACLLILLLPIGEAGAAQKVRTLHLEDLAKMLETHPLLMKAVAEEDAAAAELREASRWEDPVLGLSTGWAESLEGDHKGRSGEVELELDLPLPGRYRNAVSAARANLEASRHETAALKRRLYTELAAEFWEIARDQEWLSRLELSRQALSEMVSLAQKRVDLGEARPVDLLRFEIEAASLNSEIRAAEVQARAKRRNLARELNLSLHEELQVKAVFDLPGEPLVFEELLDRQQRSHPERLATRLRSEAAMSGLSAARWGRLPDPSLRFFAGQELDAKEIGLGLEIPLPLWNRNGSAVAAASAEASGARYEQDREAITLAADLESARANLIAAREIAVTMKQVILPKATRAAKTLLRMYEIGDVGVLELIEARRALMDTELEGLDALLECQLAHLELQTLTGESCHENENH